jgi:hypothetical protein
MNEAQILLSQAQSHLRVVKALLFTTCDVIIEQTQDLFDEDEYNDIKAMIDTIDACMRDLKKYEPR